MKTHFIFFFLILFSGCNFLDQENPTKKKAKRLMSDIVSMQTELEPKIEKLAEFGNTPPKVGMTEEEQELTAIGFSVERMYKFWKQGLENYKKQEIYMNNDLQVIRLEGLQKSLQDIADLVEKGESFSK